MGRHRAVGLLLGLSGRLLLARMRRESSVLTIVMSFFMAFCYSAMVGGIALWAALAVEVIPENMLPATVHGMFFVVMVLTAALGFVGFSGGQFFDPSRLAHLPVRSVDIFAAMAVGALVSPRVILVVPPVGMAIGMGGDVGVVVGRVGLALLAYLAGSTAALAIHFILLNYFTQRRVRDLGTWIGALAVIVFYSGFRALEESNLGQFASAGDAISGGLTAWVPTHWLADIYLGHTGFAGGVFRIAGMAMLVASLLVIGAAALARALRGEMASDVPGPVADSASWGSSVQGVSGAMVRALVWRDPRLRLLFIQQVIFVGAPLLLLVSREWAGAVGGLIFLVPMVLVFSHLFFVQGFLAIDGPALALLLATPAPRRDVLRGRALGLARMCLLTDLVIVLAVALLPHVLGRGLALTVSQCAAMTFVLVAGTIVCTVQGIILGLFLPPPIHARGRRAVSGPARSRAGLLILFSNLVCFVPALVVTGGISGFALAPFASDRIPGWMALVTVPVGLGAAWFIFLWGTTLASRWLSRREDLVLQRIADS